MRTGIKSLTFFLLIIVFSCDELGFIVTCPDCKPDEPSEIDLVIKLNESERSWNTAWVRIYEGNIEDNILLYSQNVSVEIWKYTVSINKKYTLTATYNINGANYTAVDSATPRVRYETAQCEEPCYFVYDKVVNLRIKYTK